ncbi:hypoxanthine phosphoribosyltransferase, putative [Ichthyophthirius multifiliis]|uniref:Hypoxanthine phosphoribosyltransferase n=1 Tax=Ichthyophthirius multifiliis TaxID=5932 RepID=G0R6G9_ICHMU|nr:hypoxanthine phosphoribosyltransferase, putative [Ichthyophthirius multifiliis]EGR26925.1 hypoxanthine phosphoribosyltransferase, putative [Ichthyophthirius multifiliis]|eukprot:XP_004023809.1 hypoxanthine phosphoribosyltransferase, putative [Ichthyophthirius multifiliis]
MDQNIEQQLKQQKEQRTITIKGLEFVPFISKEQLDQTVTRVAGQISRDYQGKNPVIIAILNGAFMFVSDLVKKINIIEIEVEFCKVASYQGTQSTEQLKKLIGLKSDIKDKDIIIVEDIIDTGFTINQLLKYLKTKEPKSIKVCTLFIKEANIKHQIQVDYIGLKIDQEFILGYGLDYDEYARNLEDVWILKN